MENINTVREAANNPGGRNRLGLEQKLMLSSIRDIVGIKKNTQERGFIVDPQELDALRDFTKFSDSVRENALHIRENNLEEYGEVGQTDIENMLRSEIVYQLNRLTEPLRTLRSKLPQQAKRSFPEFQRQVPDFQRHIGAKIAKLDEYELEELVSSKLKLQRFLESAFSLEQGTLNFSYREFDTLFPNIENIDPELAMRLQKIMQEYNEDGIPPSKHFILSAFHAYSSDHSQQKKIADFFGMEFHLRELLKYNILTDADLKNLAKNEIGEVVWNELTEKEQKKVIKDLKKNDLITISLDQVPEILEQADIEDFLSDTLSARISYLQERGDHGTDEIMGDISPDKNGLLHQVWLDKVDQVAKQKHINIQGLEKLQPRSVLVFSDPKDPKTQHAIRIERVDIAENAVDDGILYTVISGEHGTVSSGSGRTEFLPYDLFGKFLLSLSGARVLSHEEFTQSTTNDPKLLPKQGGSLISADGRPQVLDTTLEETETSETKLYEELDILDPKNKGILLEPGTAFVSGKNPSTGGEYPYVITQVENGNIHIAHRPGDSATEVLTFASFLSIVREEGIFRIGKLRFGNDEDFLHALGNYGVGHHAKIEDHELVGDDHSEHHNHDKHAEKKKPTYRYFEAETGGFIQVGYVGGGMVDFAEFSGIVDLEKIKKGEKLSGKEKEQIFEPAHAVPYAVFLKFLKQGGYKATTSDLLGNPDADYHGHDLHMHEDMFKRWLKKPSLADIFNGVKGIRHAIEHYLEKGSKLSASRSSLWMAKKLGLPADIVAQLSSDEISSMKEIIEKLVSKLQGLNGPVARNKALHIVHSKGSRPEEIMAAALYMVKSYGHLYAEDIKHAQGSESFINALIYACGYTSPEAIQEQKEKARTKFRSDVGTEPGGQITEEEMIWGFLKTMDGNAEANPLAGALVKAMGGPGGWERDWRTEGHKNAIEKGKRQTGDIPNPQGRRNKYFSALATHEFNTAYGMMVNVAGKDKAPAGQGAPIVWCLAGMTQYASTKLAQDGLWQFPMQGHSFHAYSFLRSKSWNDVYRDIFLQALEGIADSDDIESVKKAIADVQYHGSEEERDTKKQLKNFELINQIWIRYQGKGLHDRLQGQNSWLIDQVHTHNNEKAEEYLNIIDGAHAMMSKDQPPSNDNGWNDEFGYTKSSIIHKTSDNLRSLEWHVNKIKKEGSTNFALNQDIFQRFWPPIMDMFDTLRSDTTLSPDLKKKQYYQFRKDVLEHFRRLLNTFGRGEASADVLRSIRSQPYSRDLLLLGINLDQIFSETYDLYDGKAEEDYDAWLGGGRGITSSTQNQRVQEKTQQIILNKVSGANDAHF